VRGVKHIKPGRTRPTVLCARRPPAAPPRPQLGSGKVRAQVGVGGYATKPARSQRRHALFEAGEAFITDMPTSPGGHNYPAKGMVGKSRLAEGGAARRRRLAGAF